MNWAVVMAGGPGTRFWPLSRRKHPKPFLRLAGERTLLEETVRRLRPFFPPSEIFVVLQDSLIPETKRLLKEIPRENLLGEPVGRNTAPCCVYAASQIAERDPDARMVFLPADQSIQPKPVYLKTLKTAFDLVDDHPVLLGFRPTSPSPAFGYLEVGRKKKRFNGITYFRVIRFHEKPSPKEAEEFLRRGNFFWNGGTFIWRLEAFKEAIRRYLPVLLPAFRNLAFFPGGTSRRRALAAIYEKLPSISLDYGVMEKIKNAHCLAAPLEWRDLGGWEGAADSWPRDRANNRSQGKVLFVKGSGNIVKGDKRLVALVGVHDLLVVDSGDALLICPRSKAEEIRDLVRELERRGERRYL